jgi:predicted CXXCH cytochrome family protein
VARTRTTKKLAQRIDLNYFKRPTPLKRAKFWLSLLLPLLAVVWIAERTLTKDSRVYSAGRLSQAHAVLEKECAACHLQQAGAFSAKAADAACFNCHDGPIHHASKIAAMNCASCHTEHRGRINIAATGNQVCAECHKDLEESSSNTRYASHIRSFEDGHPEFAALRGVAGKAASNPGTIKLNHAIHMKPIRRGPNGPNVQLECGNCHRVTVADADLTYADPKYRAASISYKDTDEFLPLYSGVLKAPRSATGRELMAPVKFANACAACHLLAFDKRFDGGVPHDKPDVIHLFLVRTFREYIATHPAEVRVQRDPGRDLTGKPLPPEIRTLTPAQWVAERTTEAEDLLWRKTCKQCHTLMPFAKTSHRIIELSVTQRSEADKLSGISVELPYIAPASITLQWMPHAKFDHDAHRGFTCVSCHAKALTSTESSDVLLPGIETCKKCHAPGPEHAESRCFECHTYHDWSKRKEVTPKFTLPALRTGGSE